jgi:sulfur-carrier protein
MARVTFTQNIQRHIECPPREVQGATLREVLDAALEGNERARSYLLDDQGAVRKHIVMFINGVQALDRAHLTDPIPPDAEISVMQALSGG